MTLTPDAVFSIAPDFDILSHLEVAGGTIAGREHGRLGRGNQDAAFWQPGERCLVAVVADGCGSSDHSEVGAHLGARLWGESMTRRLDRGASADDPLLFDLVCQDVVAQLRVLATNMGGSLWSSVSEYFLFTIVGLVITPSHTAVWAAGDGAVALNGRLIPIGPFPGNRPPYLAYSMLERSAAPLQPGLLACIPTSTLDTAVIATDGAMELEQAATQTLHGTDERIGSIEQFVLEDRFFSNADAVRRRLARINREQVEADWDAQRLIKHFGPLTDDTTVIAVRRRR